MKVSMSGTTLGTMSTNYAGTKNTVSYGSGLATGYTNYDVFMRPQAIDHPGTEYDQSYGYDWQGNVTSWNSTSYAYDGMDRLTTGGYSYDVIGNQTAAPSSTTYGYIASGSQNSMRLDYKTVSGVTTDYQDDGHLANLATVAGKYTNLAYDATNRLISMYDVARGVTDSYRYEPEGLRFEKIERSLNGVDKKTYYLYEGNEILYEEGYEGTTRTFSKLNVFVGGVNVGRVKKEGSTESVQYFFMDHLESRRAVLDSAGAVQAKIDYNVWGVPTVTPYNGYDGSLDVSYTGKEQDATKLYYFNARYYDASIGRFITEDPAQNGMNWFVYCGNNPLSFTDPSGLRNIVDEPGSEADQYQLEKDTIDRSVEAAANRFHNGDRARADEILMAIAPREAALYKKEEKSAGELFQAAGDSLSGLGGQLTIATGMSAVIPGVQPAFPYLATATATIDVAAAGCYAAAYALGQGSASDVLQAGASVAFDIMGAKISTFAVDYNKIAERWISTQTGRFLNTEYAQTRALLGIEVGGIVGNILDILGISF